MIVIALLPRIREAWNAFKNPDRLITFEDSLTYGSSMRPDRIQTITSTERTVVSAICTRISLDVAAVSFRHVRLTDDGMFEEFIDSPLDRCLNISANIDQTGRSFIQDAVYSMMEEGHVALVPITAKGDPLYSDSYDIYEIRTGKVVTWFPDKVKVNVFDAKQGKRMDIVLPKNCVAIIENPLYSVMNNKNSVAQRLIRKLNLIDKIDERLASSKLDMIVQVPYTIRNKSMKEIAEGRRRSLEDQLANSKYGVAYMDGTERIVQLNRPVENNMMGQVEYLQNMLFGQIGINQAILDGTADEHTMQVYYTRTCSLFEQAIIDEMTRKWLSPKAKAEHQAFRVFRDPFRHWSVTELAGSADSLTRNAIVSSNEFRDKIGMRPSADPDADALRNKNLNPAAGDAAPEEAPAETPEETQETGESSNGGYETGYHDGYEDAVNKFKGG